MNAVFRLCSQSLPARLGTAVVDVLLNRIVSGELEPGTLLPTEPRLSEVFSVSRTVIREAVKILEQKGLVRARQGQGTRVALPDEWNLLDPMVLEASVRHDKDLRILDDLVEVRRVLEAEMAREAAMRSTAEDREDMRRLLGQLAADAGTPDRHMLTDLEFHDAIPPARARGRVRPGGTRRRRRAGGGLGACRPFGGSGMSMGGAPHRGTRGLTGRRATRRCRRR
jgi:DNA-binding FadR family transcriptional regulator